MVVYLDEPKLDEEGPGGVVGSLLTSGGCPVSERVLRRGRVRCQEQSCDEFLDQLGVLVGCPAALVG